MSILTEAEELINGDRQEAYSHPAVNFDRIAKGWEVILGTEVTPKDVALCMIWVKVARETNKHSRENVVDMAGYAGTIEMVEDYQQLKNNKEELPDGILVQLCAKCAVQILNSGKILVNEEGVHIRVCEDCYNKYYKGLPWCQTQDGGPWD